MSFTLSVSVESRSTSSSVTSDPVSAFSSVWDTAYSEKERIERVGFSFVSLFVWAEQGPLNYFCMQCVHHGAMQHLHPQNEDSAGIYLLHFISTLHWFICSTHATAQRYNFTQFKMPKHVYTILILNIPKKKGSTKWNETPQHGTFTTTTTTTLEGF